jgi:hypothetical protein
MPPNLSAWFQTWAEKRIPEMLVEHDEAERAKQSALQKRLWRWMKSVVMFLLGTIVGAYILKMLGLC